MLNLLRGQNIGAQLLYIWNRAPPLIIFKGLKFLKKRKNLPFGEGVQFPNTPSLKGPSNKTKIPGSKDPPSKPVVNPKYPPPIGKTF